MSLTTTRRPRRYGNIRGQSLAEFGMVVPMLLLLLFGTIEFGRLWAAKQVVTTASREAARLKSLNASDGDIQTRVNTLLTAERLPVTSINVAGPTGTPPLRTVTVTVTSDVPTFMAGLLPGISNPQRLTSATTMRFEEASTGP